MQPQAYMCSPIHILLGDIECIYDNTTSSDLNITKTQDRVVFRKKMTTMGGG